MIFPDFSLTFPVCSKFPDFFLTGKCLPIFPGFLGFPVLIDSFRVGMVKSWNSTRQIMERTGTVRPAALWIALLMVGGSMIVMIVTAEGGELHRNLYLSHDRSKCYVRSQCRRLKLYKENYSNSVLYLLEEIRDLCLSHGFNSIWLYHQNHDSLGECYIF